MNKIANGVVAVTAMICCAALAVSIYPGVLNGLILPGLILAVLIAPVVGIAGLIAAVIFAWKGWFRGIRPPGLQLMFAVAILFCTYALLKLFIPRRIAFIMARPAFERLTPHAEQPARPALPPNYRVGLYTVDEAAIDPRGGYYLKTYSHADGLGPDCVSYGFAYKPNREGTPFGAAHYRLHTLSGDWYWFRVSDDWF